MGALPFPHDRLRDFSSENVMEMSGAWMIAHACISRSVIRRNEMKTPKFDGSCEIKEFFVQFDQVARWNGWTVGDCQSIMSLQGRSWMKFPYQIRTIFIFLKKRYKIGSVPTKRRQTGDSVEDFWHSLRRLAIKVYPNCSFASIETHVIDQFIYGFGDIDIGKTWNLTTRLQ